MEIPKRDMEKVKLVSAVMTAFWNYTVEHKEENGELVFHIFEKHIFSDPLLMMVVTFDEENNCLLFKSINANFAIHSFIDKLKTATGLEVYQE